LCIFFPDYNYDGFATTPEERNLLFENTRNIKGNEAIIDYHGLSDDRVYYHFTSQTEIDGLEYETDYSGIVIVPFFVVLLILMVLLFGETKT